ncbi:hypothetical protein QYM36_002019 [Artemia franciscana]|uniref:Reverse transcriptase domain-containing protein n=1 Tax=Artemia franciscana TaxID=6661 RepID=A0AA88LGI8_ARTSF|nr:hypothetical protein QYM36_002019 [Artemia franciscana]
MLNWAQPYQLSPGQYGHPQGWPNQYQGQSSYSHGYASAPSNCINVQQNSVIQQEKVNNPPCYNVPIANRFTPLSSEQFPALSCESDDEIRAVANPYDVEGAKRQTEMPRLGQIQNFGCKRRDVSPGSNKSYILETKRQNIDKLPKQEFSNINIPTAEQFTTKVEIEVINKGEVLPPDFDLVKFFKVLLTSHSDLDKANASVKHMEKIIGKEDPDEEAVSRMAAKVKRLTNKDQQEPYNQPFSLVEIEDIIRYLPNTAPGADMVYPQLVKNLPQEWVEVLLEIINIAWKSGCFPKVWKAGLAVMIPKPGKDTSKIENHRFITLLPVLGKVYERLVKKRLNWEVEKRKILKDVQCGFRRNKSTIDNLVCFQRDAAYTLQNGLIIDLILITNADDQPNKSKCYWSGTAPVCFGSCKLGETVAEISAKGDGQSCVFGRKVLCCPESANIKPETELKIGCIWKGNAPFCSAECDNGFEIVKNDTALTVFAKSVDDLIVKVTKSILPCTRQHLEPNTVLKTKFLKARISQQERQKQTYDKTSKDLIELKDNQPIWVKLSKEATRWTIGVVMSCMSPRSYLIQAENGKFYCRNWAHLKPRSSAEGNSAQQSSGFTGGEDFPAEIHPPVTQSSSPKNAAPKTPDNRSTGEIFQDSPYRTATPPPAANSNSRNGEDYSRPYVTRTSRLVKARKIMDI